MINYGLCVSARCYSLYLVSGISSILGWRSTQALSADQSRSIWRKCVFLQQGAVQGFAKHFLEVLIVSDWELVQSYWSRQGLPDALQRGVFVRRCEGIGAGLPPFNSLLNHVTMRFPERRGKSLSAHLSGVYTSDLKRHPKGKLLYFLDYKSNLLKYASWKGSHTGL